MSHSRNRFRYRNRRNQRKFFHDVQALTQFIRTALELREGDVVAILSNGGFGGIYDKLPARLRSLHEVTTQA